MRQNMAYKSPFAAQRGLKIGTMERAFDKLAHELGQHIREEHSHPEQSSWPEGRGMGSEDKVTAPCSSHLNTGHREHCPLRSYKRVSDGIHQPVTVNDLNVT